MSLNRVPTKVSLCAVLVSFGDPVPGVGHVFEHDSLTLFTGHPGERATLCGLGQASLSVQMFCLLVKTRWSLTGGSAVASLSRR